MAAPRSTRSPGCAARASTSDPCRRTPFPGRPVAVRNSRTVLTVRLFREVQAVRAGDAPGGVNWGCGALRSGRTRRPDAVRGRPPVRGRRARGCLAPPRVGTFVPSVPPTSHPQYSTRSTRPAAPVPRTSPPPRTCRATGAAPGGEGRRRPTPAALVDHPPAPGPPASSLPRKRRLPPRLPGLPPLVCTQAGGAHSDRAVACRVVGGAGTASRPTGWTASRPTDCAAPTSAGAPGSAWAGSSA